MWKWESLLSQTLGRRRQYEQDDYISDIPDKDAKPQSTCNWPPWKPTMSTPTLGAPPPLLSLKCTGLFAIPQARNSLEARNKPSFFWPQGLCSLCQVPLHSSSHLIIQQFA